MIYVTLSNDGKTIVSVFSCPQENAIEISADDARYADFYNSQPDFMQQILEVPETERS